MKSLLILGGRIFDPGQGIDETGNILINEGIISLLGNEGIIPEADCTILHAEGFIVCPGFIDLHCHLREPGYEEKETISTGSKAAARGGFTTICCMPNTDPPLDNQSGIDYVKSTAEREGAVRVLTIGCISKERKGEQLAHLKEMAAAGVIGFSDDGDPAATSQLMQQALELSLTLALPIIDHCENTALSIGGQMNDGMLANKLGLRGIPAAAEETIVARDLALAELTGGRLHIAHASTAGTVKLIRQAKERRVRVSAEVTPHHLTLTEERVNGHNTDAKVNPPLRTERDIRALIQGLKENVIDIIATDHAPHTKTDKECDFTLAASGISGFETALGSLMSLVHNGQLPLETIITKITSAPARIIGNKYGIIGTLTCGASADITIFDPDCEWTVDSEDFISKGKNTPLDGSRLKGRVIATIAQGEIVYKDDLVQVEENQE
ncbi:dihydroorotase [Chloroflexota bacterium]